MKYSRLSLGSLAIGSWLLGCAAESGDSNSGSHSGGTDSGDSSTGSESGSSSDGSGSTGLTDESSSEGGSDASGSDSTGGDVDCSMLADELQCTGAAECQAVLGNALEPIGDEWCHTAEQYYFGCIAMQGCDDALTFWCAGDQRFLTPDSCGLAAWENCGMPQGYAGECP